MRTRHRIPSIFNLSMVDVLCCALGCVILLWLLNLREAKLKAVQAVRARDEATRLHDEGTALARELEDARARLAELGTRHETLTRRASATDEELGRTRRRVSELSAEVDRAGAQAAAVGRERDEARARGAQLARDLDAARAAVTAAEGQLAQRTRAVTDLRQQLAAAGDSMAALRLRLDEGTRARAATEKELAAARTRAEGLGAQVKEKEDQVGELARQAAGLAGKLKEAEARLGEKVKEGGTQASQLAAVREELKAVRQSLTREEALARALQKEVTQRSGELEAGRGALVKQTAELDAARQLLAAVQEEKQRLKGEADRFRLAADNRFAGLSLTGRRVVFLVDMSGSMELVDVNTRAPGKWESVRQTVAKVMRSLPDLEKFQVILFSEKALYPLGGEGSWLEYAPDSAGRLLQTLARIKPSGDTDMYTAFAEAFRLRGQGLDTIYLFSDGLPNMGQGLTAEQSRTLKETEQGEVLGRHIRRKLASEWNKEAPGQPKVRINAVGFFFESPDVGAFLWALTRENNGAFVGMSQP